MYKMSFVHARICCENGQKIGKFSADCSRVEVTENAWLAQYP